MVQYHYVIGVGKKYWLCPSVLAFPCSGINCHLSPAMKYVYFIVADEICESVSKEVSNIVYKTLRSVSYECLNLISFSLHILHKLKLIFLQFFKCMPFKPLLLCNHGKYWSFP
jgi:hypothetical protein